MPPTKPTGYVFELDEFLKDIEVIKERHSYVLYTDPALLVDLNAPYIVNQKFACAQFELILHRDRLDRLVGKPLYDPFDLNYAIQQINLLIETLVNQRKKQRELFLAAQATL